MECHIVVIIRINACLPAQVDKESMGDYRYYQ